MPDNANRLELRCPCFGCSSKRLAVVKPTGSDRTIGTLVSHLRRLVDGVRARRIEDDERLGLGTELHCAHA